MATQSAPTNYEETRQDIEETLGFVPGYFGALNEQDLVNEWPNFKRHAFGETEIPAKYKEMIGLAVAANLKCPYCQRFHKDAATLHGATEAELAEVAFLASWTARYSSLIHGQDYDIDTFVDEHERIVAHLEQHAAGDD